MVYGGELVLDYTQLLLIVQPTMFQVRAYALHCLSRDLSICHIMLRLIDQEI